MKKRYLSLNEYFKKTFNCKVYKISIDAGFTCPNRDGKKSTSGCVFCATDGSSSRTNKNISITDQINNNIVVRKNRYRSEKYIAYFQSHSNTYANKETLKQLYDAALFAHPDIVGLAISTRSDCVDEEKIQLIASYKKFLPYVSLELGMQTMKNQTLEKLNRCESHEDFLNAISLAKKYRLSVCAHVILGLIDENGQDLINTANALAKAKIDAVKIHLLTALKNTPLGNLFLSGKWQPLTMQEYTVLAANFLERLPLETAVHRLSGSAHPENILAPFWIYENKALVDLAINQELIRRNSHQGALCRH